MKFTFINNVKKIMFKQEFLRRYFKLNKKAKFPVNFGISNKIFFLYFFNNYLKRRRFFRMFIDLLFIELMNKV